MTTQPTSLAWSSRSQRPLSGAAAQRSRSSAGRSLAIVVTVMTLLVMVAM